MNCLKVAATLISLLAGCSHAFAYCMEPSAPYRKPTKPVVPYCVNQYANTHTCDDWEISSFNQQVDMFNDDHRRYVKALNAYLDEAVAYAQCELNALKN